MILAFITASAASVIQIPETSYGHIAESGGNEVVANQVITVDNTEAIVRNYFRDIPLLAEVARCESGFRHKLDDGSILKGKVDPADTGVMQINRRYHEESATALELDLDDIYHNMAYARHLYETEGIRPWNSSMPCWGNTLAANI